MKILISTDQIHLHGGIEKVMAVKANWFADVLGYEVVILTTEQKSLLPRYELSKKIILKDLGVNYVRTKSYYHPENVMKIKHHYFAWKTAVRELNPDILITCNYSFDFYWIPFCFKKIPKVKEFHSSRYYENQTRGNSGFLKGILYKLNDFIESKFTAVVVLNADEVPFFYSSNIVVIPNPVQVFSTIIAPLVNKKVIAAGRIAEVKGFDVMISVWNAVVKKCPDWKLHIYGDGEQRYIDELNQQIVDLNVADSVFIHPAISELLTEMAQSSIYLMTSKTECYPMVLIEALSVGLPIISFDCPTGPRNIIKNEITGFITPNQNKNAIAEKVVLLMKNQSLRKEFGTCAILDATNFQVERTMVLWENLFDKIKK